MKLNSHGDLKKQLAWPSRSRNDFNENRTKDKKKDLFFPMYYLLSSFPWQLAYIVVNDLQTTRNAVKKTNRQGVSFF